MIVTGAVSGAMVLQEQNYNTVGGIVGYCFAIVLILFAIALLQFRESPWVAKHVYADREVDCPCYDRCAASVRRRIDSAVGGGAGEGSPALEPAKGAASVEGGAPERKEAVGEATHLLPPSAAGGVT